MPDGHAMVEFVNDEAGFDEHLLLEKNSRGRFTVKTHRGQALQDEVLSSFNGYWPTVSGAGQKIGDPVTNTTHTGWRGVRDFTPEMQVFPYRNIKKVRRIRKRSSSNSFGLTSVPLAGATPLGFRPNPIVSKLKSGGSTTLPTRA